MKQIATFMLELIECFKAIGADATEYDPCYGLRCYAYFHSRPKIHGLRWEESIWRGLQNKLNGFSEKGVIQYVDTEVPYPNGGRCDLVFDIRDEGKVWIEGKFIPTHYLNDLGDDNAGINKWWDSISEITRKDLPHLRGLTRSSASYIGILLYGADRVNLPLPESELRSQLPKEVLLWNSGHPPGGIWWPDISPLRANTFRDRLWLWYRPVE